MYELELEVWRMPGFPARGGLALKGATLALMMLNSNGEFPGAFLKLFTDLLCVDELDRSSRHADTVGQLPDKLCQVSAAQSETMCKISSKTPFQHYLQGWVIS